MVNIRLYIAEVTKVKNGFQTAGAPFAFTYILRPISFFITPAFVKMGVPANKVTILGGVLLIISLVLFTLGDFISWILAVSLFNSYTLLDLIDGNVARITGTTSYLGKFLDGAIDTLGLSILPFAIGWGQYLETGQVKWFGIGAVTGVSMLLAMYLMTRLSFHREWLRTDFLQNTTLFPATPKFQDSEPGSRISIGLLVNYIFFGLIVFTLLGMREYFIIGYAFFASLWCPTVIWDQYSKAQKLLNVRRTSKHTKIEK